jgi:hypothetical protein
MILQPELPRTYRMTLRDTDVPNRLWNEILTMICHGHQSSIQKATAKQQQQATRVCILRAIQDLATWSNGLCHLVVARTLPPGRFQPFVLPMCKKHNITMSTRKLKLFRVWFGFDTQSVSFKLQTLALLSPTWSAKGPLTCRIYNQHWLVYPAGEQVSGSDHIGPRLTGGEDLGAPPRG